MFFVLKNCREREKGAERLKNAWFEKLPEFEKLIDKAYKYVRAARNARKPKKSMFSLS